jgi:DNA-binding transcriptional regulator YdaS (Cro superfamily)
MNGEKFTALEEAIEMAGGLRKLARAISRSPGTIKYWLRQGKITRGPDAIAVHRAVRGRVSRARLAPDVFGPSLTP